MFREYFSLPRLVYIVCLGTIVNRCGYFLITFLSFYVDAELRLGPTVATLAVAMFGLGAACAAFVGGHLADTLGRKTVALIALFGSAVLVLLLSTFRAPIPVLFGVLAFALVNDMYRPAISAMMTDVVPSAQRPTAFGLLYLAINLGAAIAPAIGGLLAGSNFLYLFFGDAFSSALYAAIIAVAIPETLKRTRRGAEPVPAPVGDSAVDAGEGSETTGEAGKHQAPVARNPRGGYAEVLKDRVFVRVCLATLCISLAFMQAMSTFPLYVRQLGYGPEVYGYLILINGAMIVVFQIFVNRAVTKFHRGGMLILSALVTAIGFGSKAFATTPWGLAVAVAIWTVGEMIQAPLLHSITADLAPEHLRARYFGMLTICFSGASCFGAVAGGQVFQYLGARYVWLGAFAVAATGAIVYSTIHRELRSPRA